MSFNKKAHLQANIQAIQITFTLDKEQRKPTIEEQYLLKQYAGFGGLKCVLNPANALTDIQYWAKSEVELFPLVAELHNVVRENTTNENEYKRYFNSIKNSVLTAFYTPRGVVDALADAFRDSGITPSRILDPSAGTGEFAHAFYHSAAEQKNAVAFEKDLLTGKILSHLSPDMKVNIEGFETIEGRYNNYFDLVSSNIPFGEMGVFDSSFSRSNDKVKQNATKHIHNYYFIKGVETLREGGMLAFITSQGVMNSPANEDVRKWLMDNTNLISAVRLPNNLFTDYAGTEVGSDLIILQKNSQKQSLTEEEQAFLSTRELSNGITINNYFQDFSNVVHTKGYNDTDPYGKPAFVFEHEGGIEGISKDLKKLLDNDFSKKVNLGLYGVQPVQQTARDSQQVIEKPLEVNVSESISLYDLFGFTQEERTQIKPKGRTKKQIPPKGKAVQLSMFSDTSKADTKNTNAYPISDARKEEQQDRLKREEEKKKAMELRTFSGDLQKHYKAGSLVEDQEQIGYLKEVYKDGAEFQPLDLHFAQRAKISRYIEIRDFYHTLYNHEAERLEEHASLRSNLNLVYDNFVKRYGYLNDKKNLDVIKMDAGGNEMLFLERSIDGKLQKADIFHKPVAFNPNEIKVANTSDEALVASLNKYGEIHLAYMESLMTEKSREEIIADLQGRIFFNPSIQNYEIRDSFIAGNVVEKAERIERYLQNHPDDKPAQESLKALQDATPLPIRFEELDFNFGERWIGTGVFEQYISKLFDTNVSIDYYPSRDDFTVKANSSNTIINDKFAVQGESRLYTGMHLLKHALLNTTPNITKTISVTDKDTGEERKVKVADGEKIQLANTKIDEIRNGLSDWLDEQSPEFKDNLADIYNRKFNCFVRPQYDGSHQTFPDLDLKALGIPDLYQSQKDCIWMQKLMGGGIADHEVGAGKTLIMCVAAYEMKRLGIANKPMIVGLKANVHEVAQTFKTAYPNAKILYPGKEDFTPSKRVKIFNEIKNNSCYPKLSIIPTFYENII